jgi:hypothetical protein
MTIETIRDTLAWCTVINMAFLLFWWLFMAVAHDWIYRMHSRWFHISAARFDKIHYQGIVLLKLGIVLFNLTPYLALRIVG